MIYFNISNCFDNGLRFYYKNSSIKVINAGTTSVVPVAYENITVKQLLDNCKFGWGNDSLKSVDYRGLSGSTSNNSVSFPGNFSYNTSERTADNTVYYLTIMGFEESNFGYRVYYYKKDTVNEVWDTDYAKGNHAFDKYKYSSYILVRDYTTYGSPASGTSCCYDIRYGNNQLDIPYLCRGNGAAYTRYDLIKEVEITEPSPSYAKVKYRLYGVPNTVFGTRTVTWTTGALWWKKTHSATVTSYLDAPKCESANFKTYTAGTYWPTDIVNLQNDAGGLGFKIRGSTLSGNYEDFNRFGFYMEPGKIYVFDTKFMMTSTSEHLQNSNYVNHSSYRPYYHKEYYREGYFYKTAFNRDSSPTAICDWAVSNITNKINNEC